MPTAIARYKVEDGKTVVLNVTIGDAQEGGSSAYVGTRQVALGPKIQNKPIGDGSELRGKVLVVSTTVVDVRPEHDRTSVTVELMGGYPEPFPIVQSTTTSPGGAVNYLTVIRFV